MLALVLVLVACGPAGDDKDKPEPGTGTTDGEGEEKTPEGEETAGETPFKENSLYLITDLGTIDDKSFNQGSFEGLQNYAKEVGLEAKYLRPAGEGTQNYIQAINQVIQEGAEVVVTPGFLFDQAVGQAQQDHENVKFIAVDFVPQVPQMDEAGNQVLDDKNNPVTESLVADNTTAILYKEEQSGFLAGYAAVKDGYTKLGFMGGVAVPAVVKFGFGYIAGANYAAEEMGVKVEVKYNYTGSFEAKPEIQTMAASWYQGGTEVIFGCGGGIAASILKAAQDNNAKMIGVDVDQKDLGPEVITSAMKNLQGSVRDAVAAAGEGNFPGGETLVLGVESNGVQISDDFSRFNTFTQADYDAIYQKLVDNTDNVTDSIPNDTSNQDPSSFAADVPNVAIDYIP